MTLYNLGSTTRNKLYKDRYVINQYWRLEIKAGYGNSLETLFQGNIYEAMSQKQGQDWITSIEGFDGMHGIQNGFSSQTFESGTNKQDIIRSVTNDMPNILVGALGSPTESQGSKRGQVLIGNSSKIIAEQTGGKYFIDNEKLNSIGDDEVLSGNQVIILDGNQLFSTPKRRDTFIDCSILFFPKAQAGLLCEIRSGEPIDRKSVV